jgi:hypothetical protein
MVSRSGYEKAAGITGGFQTFMQTFMRADLAAETTVRSGTGRIAAIQSIMAFLGVTFHLFPFLVGPANAVSEAGSRLANGAAPQSALFGGPGFLRPLFLHDGLFFSRHRGAGGKCKRQNREKRNGTKHDDPRKNLYLNLTR